jgi:hypothetical protein
MRVELGKLDLVRLRVRVHAQLPALADRLRFDRETDGAGSERLVDAGARAIVRAELLASYAAPVERVSGVVPVARLRLVRKAAG